MNLGSLFLKFETMEDTLTALEMNGKYPYSNGNTGWEIRLISVSNKFIDGLKNDLYDFPQRGVGKKSPNPNYAVVTNFGGSIENLRKFLDEYSISYIHCYVTTVKTGKRTGFVYFSDVLARHNFIGVKGRAFTTIEKDEKIVEYYIPYSTARNTIEFDNVQAKVAELRKARKEAHRAKEWKEGAVIKTDPYYESQKPSMDASPKSSDIDSQDTNVLSSQKDCSQIGISEQHGTFMASAAAHGFTFPPVQSDDEGTFSPTRKESPKRETNEEFVDYGEQEISRWQATFCFCPKDEQVFRPLFTIFSADARVQIDTVVKAKEVDASEARKASQKW
eukprot:CAMPEP_0168521194 /NCGR_PEP_ID=MMETSP0405-20121227/8508_1 /TAXON_ID=498012 /ORGANISM="Trichosphaerium sp, Strain Am-I-7 wt" /LENGTH=332 /DNA_ID=CAMNT_0008542361 /DNA_START=568 /DNA_END=1563 /DNA_ORIENTATION=+